MTHHPRPPLFDFVINPDVAIPSQVSQPPLCPEKMAKFDAEMMGKPPRPPLFDPSLTPGERFHEMAKVDAMNKMAAGLGPPPRPLSREEQMGIISRGFNPHLPDGYAERVAPPPAPPAKAIVAVAGGHIIGYSIVLVSVGADGIGRVVAEFDTSETSEALILGHIAEMVVKAQHTGASEIVLAVDATCASLREKMKHFAPPARVVSIVGPGVEG